MAVSEKAGKTGKLSENKAKAGTAKPRAAKKPTAGRSQKKAGTSKGNKTKSLEEINDYHDHLAFETGLTIFVILSVSVFLYLSYFRLAGSAGIVVGGLIFGFFGWFAWILPFVCLTGYVFCTVNRGDRRVPRKIFGFAGMALALLGLTDLIFKSQTLTEFYTSNHVLHKKYFECMFLSCADMCKDGKFTGGLCGRAVSLVFSSVIGKIGAGVILFVLFLLCLYIFYGVEMMALLRRRNAYRQEIEEIYEEVSKDEDFREPSYQVFPSPGRGTRRVPVQPREMERVPKVSFFDLKGTPDEMLFQKGQKKTGGKAGEKLSAGKADRAQNLREAEDAGTDFGTGADVDLDAGINIAHREKKETGRNIGINAALDTGKAEGTRRTENGGGRKKATVQMETAVQEDIATCEMQEGTEQIPIYRNELNEKFRKKKRASQPLVNPRIFQDMQDGTESADGGQPELLFDVETSLDDDKPLFEVKESLPEDQMFSEPQEEKERQILSAKLGEEQQQGQVFPDGLEEEQEEDEEMLFQPKRKTESRPKPPATLEEDWEQEEIQEDSQPPLFGAENGQNAVHGQSLAEETENIEPAVPSIGGARQRASSHGKIGGEKYISASDTFNALNESKVSVPKEVPYEFPPIDLLSVPEATEGNLSDEELRATALKLQSTLKSFNVNVQMGAVTCGPTVTQYELLPEQGVRVNKITNLADDLKLSLAAASIRIEAPIPGKAAVGVEVPNPVPSSVYFRELLEGDAFHKATSDLTFAVGKDIAGKLILADIAKMPHLLIAGATGSGKSVCINTLIMSILYKADPKDVKLIMIDPKVVELSVYNGIPHLFCPVVTDAKEAAAALNWAVREMMDRYNRFKELGVRTIAGYNKKVRTVEGAEEAGYTKMPYLVVIVDEFADLMMVASKEVEESVSRLTQLARAAGIHLVLATQRPSVNVITGLIKANIPSRIAFSVSSVVDSRTILDQGGAEKLLGKGDMLFFPSGYSEPVRVQGAFVSDQEVSDITDFLRSNNEEPEYDHSVTEISEEKLKEEPTEKKPHADRDDYFEEAGRFIIESGRAAAGQLQRHFSIGFNRAGRIIDQLNKAGVVGPAEGTKPRKVLMEIEEFEQMLSGGAGQISDAEMESMVREMEEESVATQEIH